MYVIDFIKISEDLDVLLPLLYSFFISLRGIITVVRYLAGIVCLQNRLYCSDLFYVLVAELDQL